MGLILNIETATTNCSVSLSLDGETLFLREDNSQGYSHAELLHVFIKDLFTETKLQPEAIHAVAVSKGPGSYTGLRIGVSTAKGLCYALDKPLIALDTLEILAHQIKVEEGHIIPMIDARRMEVYSAVFAWDLVFSRKVEAEIISKESYSDLLNIGKVYFIGNGVEKTKTLINHPNAVFFNGRLPSANEMGKLAEAKYKIGDFEDVAYFEPYYLKDFIALKKQS